MNPLQLLRPPAHNSLRPNQSEKGFLPDPSYLLPRPRPNLWEGQNLPKRRTDRAPKSPDFELPTPTQPIDDVINNLLKTMDPEELLNTLQKSFTDNPGLNKQYGLQLPTTPKDIWEQRPRSLSRALPPARYEEI